MIAALSIRIRITTYLIAPYLVGPCGLFQSMIPEFLKNSDDDNPDKNPDMGILIPESKYENPDKRTPI